MKMAEEIESAKNSVDLMVEVFQLGSTFDDVSRIIALSRPFTAALPLIGAILGLIGGFLPGQKHEEILSRFNQLSDKIDLVRSDIRKLNNDLSLDIMQAQYLSAVTRIESGIDTCLRIGKAGGMNQTMVAQKQLKDICNNYYCDVAVKSLLDGMTGNGFSNTGTLLDKLYIQTKGSRPEMLAHATRLLKLTFGGMMVISTYRTMIDGKEAADNTIKEEYNSRLKNTFDAVKSIIKKCKKEFKTNMLTDLNIILDEGGSNKGLIAKIRKFMRNKYDWLETFVLVYNDLQGFENHCFGGYHVNSLHRNGKCGVVFYREKYKSQNFPARYGEIYKFVDDDLCGMDFGGHTNAEKCYDSIVDKMNAKGIGWIGFAVIKRRVDLWIYNNFSIRTEYVFGMWYTKILLLA